VQSQTWASAVHIDRLQSQQRASLPIQSKCGLECGPGLAAAEAKSSDRVE